MGSLTPDFELGVPTHSANTCKKVRESRGKEKRGRGEEEEEKRRRRGGEEEEKRRRRGEEEEEKRRRRGGEGVGKPSFHVSWQH